MVRLRLFYIGINVRKPRHGKTTLVFNVRKHRQWEDYIGINVRKPSQW